MHHMAKATLIMRSKWVQGELLVEMVLWQLPRPSAERPHGLKYRLYMGRVNQDLVRYDNEKGKGDHRHVGSVEENYSFSTLEKLLRDFRQDCEQLGWRWDT